MAVQWTRLTTQLMLRKLSILRLMSSALQTRTRCCSGVLCTDTCPGSSCCSAPLKDYHPQAALGLTTIRVNGFRIRSSGLVTMKHMKALGTGFPSNREGAASLIKDTSILIKTDAHLVGEDLAGVLRNGKEDTH